MFSHFKIICFFIFLITISCSNNKVVNNHGLTGLDSKSNKLYVNKSNKNDALELIGVPSSVSLFDENTWFYIERSKVTKSVIKLGKSEILNNNVLELTFNDMGILEAKKLYKKENMNELNISKETTTKNYDAKSYLDKLFISIKQKIDAPKKNR